MQSPPSIFLERLFKPSVTWEGEPAINSLDAAEPLDAEQPDIIRGPANEITPSAHVIMAVIAPWTETLLTYPTIQEIPQDQKKDPRLMGRAKKQKKQQGRV